MSDKTSTEVRNQAGAAREAGTMLLATGGLAAALGAASCCALPLILGMIGLSSAWLGSAAVLAGPYQRPLLAVAVASVFGGGALIWRRRRAACAPGAACARPGLDRFAKIGLSLTALLVALTLVTA